MTTALKTSIATHMMTDAVEGPGIAYWAEVQNVERNAETNYVTSFEVRDAGSEGPRVSKAWVKVDETAILAGAEKLRSGTVKVRPDIAAQFVGTEWDYDSEGVDCVIQAMCFNDIVFG